MSTPAFGVIPHHDPCKLCGDTGWITCVDYDDSGYEIPCPEGCPTSGQPAEWNQDEAPF